MKLFYKSTAFVIILLSGQVAVYCALSTIESWSERQSDTIAHSNDIVADCLFIHAEMDQCIAAVCLFGMSRESKVLNGFADHEHRVFQALERLTANTAGNQIDHSAAAKIDERAHYIFQVVVPEFRQTLARPDLSHLDLLLLRQRVMQELLPMLTEERNAIQELSTRHRQYIQPMMSNFRAQRDSVRTAILCGSLLSAVGALASVWLFSKGVIRRLSNLAENFERLRSNKPLSSVPEDADEIGLLGRQFRDMAQSLKEAIEKDRAVMENIPVGLVICNTESVIESVNSPAAAMLSTEKSELSGQKFTAFLSNQDNSAPNSSGLQGRNELLVQNREPLPVEIYSAKFLSRGETKILYAVADVSVKVEIEQLKEEFMAIVSHDLGTPLLTMRMQLALLAARNPVLDPDSTKTLKVVDGEIDRLVKLTKDLLEVAKLESGRIVLERHQVDPAAIMERVAETMTAEASRRSVTIEVDTASECTINADPDRVSQILTNLVSNAIKFSPQGGVIIMSTRQTPDGSTCLLEVADQGPGVPKEFHSSIFERYKQVRASDAKIGTGLGLAICKLFAEEHGGSIRVESEPPNGARFIVELPAYAHPLQG